MVMLASIAGVPVVGERILDAGGHATGHAFILSPTTGTPAILANSYAPKEREQIREIMRWVGPRMIFYSPKEAIRHLFNI